MKKPIKLAFLLFASFAFLAANAQQEEFGQAFLFDSRFQGSLTAYNVKYDKNDMTAGHKIHPYGTLLKVTRLDNKQSVVVKVIDKGPYKKKGDILYLSEKAWRSLGLTNEESANIKLEVYKKASVTSETSQAVAQTQPKTTTPKTEEVPAGYDDTSASSRQPSRTVSNTKTTASASQQPPASSSKTAPAKDKLTEKGGTATTAKVRLVKQDYAQYGLYKIQLEKPEQKGFGVQVASLTSYESVLRQIANLQSKSFTNILVSIEKGTNNKPSYKVILGPHDSEAAANNYKKSLKSRYKINGFVVDLATLTY